MTTIVISSRRNSTREIAHRLNETLAKGLPNATLFNGVEKINAPGMTLLDAIPHVAGQCDALLVLIGSDWASDTAWLNNAKDFNRTAIATALTQKRRVIPVLLDGASLPAGSHFSGDLSEFGQLTPVRINAATFDQDVAGLLQAIKGNSGSAAPRPAAPAQPTPSVVTVNTPPAPRPVTPAPQEAPVATPVAITPQTTTSVTAAPNVAQQLSQTLDMIIGQTKSQTTTLYTLPDVKSQVRTEIPPVKPVVVLARDKNSEWLNVVHVSTTQQQLFGWVPANAVENLSFKGRSVVLLDLNMSQFEHNSHDDIVELIRLENAKNSGPAGQAVLLSVAAIAIMAIGSAISPALAGIGVAVGLVLLIGAWVQYGMKTAPTTERIKQLEAIRKKKRSSAQVAGEAASAAAKTAVSTAVGLAALLGTAAVVANASKSNSKKK